MLVAWGGDLGAGSSDVVVLGSSSGDTTLDLSDASVVTGDNDEPNDQIVGIAFRRLPNQRHSG